MADKTVVQLAYELSEKRLASQLSAGLAADARAMGFAAIMIAAASILAGLAKDSANPLAMLIGSVILLASAGLAGIAARPLKFYMPGAKFSDLSEDIETDAKFIDVLTELGEYNDQNSVENDAVLNGNARGLRVAFFVSMIGVAAAAVPQFDEDVVGKATHKVAGLYEALGDELSFKNR